MIGLVFYSEKRRPEPSPPDPPRHPFWDYLVRVLLGLALLTLTKWSPW